MRCPLCKKSMTWDNNPFRPFCSERCKLIDLDNWLAERYRVPAPAEVQEMSPSEENSAPDAEGDRG